MPRPLVAMIDIAAMQHNCALAKSCIPQAKTWAVVKANAYGHGLDNAIQGFADADGLAILEIDRAVYLRNKGWVKPILLLEGFFDAADIKIALDFQLDVVVHCVDQLAMLSATTMLSARLNVHIKVNSGMNRLGFMPGEVKDVYTRLRLIDGVHHIGFMTHLANADTPGNVRLPVDQQAQVFYDAIDGLPGVVHIQNSAGNLFYSKLKTDWVRAGIMLYGATPGVKSSEDLGLKPVMTLQSKIIAIQHINVGDAVGYGSCFVADKTMVIGVVACGYADGYPRHAPTGTPILVNGVKTRIVGRVSMDMITVDVTDIADAKIGSEVILWGRGLPIDEVATAAGTIGYELMCAITTRVPLLTY